MCIPVCVWRLEADIGVFLAYFSSLYVVVRPLTYSQGSLTWTSLAGYLLWEPCLCFSSTGLQTDCHSYLALHLGSGNLNFNSHSWTLSTLPSEPSP